MERTTWPDQRLDDLARRVDSGFNRIDQDIRELRITVLQVGGGLIATMLVGFLSVLAAILTTA